MTVVVVARLGLVLGCADPVRLPGPWAPTLGCLKLGVGVDDVAPLPNGVCDVRVGDGTEPAERRRLGCTRQPPRGLVT